ncbi:MAG: ArgR family transcriptional regulator [Gammaproteobacteria bacterium]|nr:ArgR family transcriptional regulator [Gammaproteobacteria bacterium]
MPNSITEQAERRDAIRQLLQLSPAQTQQFLVDALLNDGLVATQSSVSRDLRELGAIKTPRGYELPGDSESANGQMADAAGLLRKISPAGPNLLVIRTAIGAAQRVALALDRADWPEMVGNIGGDDTVFVATESASAQKRLVARIERSARI